MNTVAESIMDSTPNVEMPTPLVFTDNAAKKVKVIPHTRNLRNPRHNSLRTVINRTRAVCFDVAWNGPVAAQQLFSGLGPRGA